MDGDMIDKFQGTSAAALQASMQQEEEEQVTTLQVLGMEGSPSPMETS